MRGFWMLLFVFYKFWVVKCEELASFYGNSYISIPLQEAYASNDIEFNFRTWLPDAMFLLVAGRTDFCIVQLESGLVKLRINLGAGEEEISSPNDVKFNDGDWHFVKIIRKEANLTLEIDHVHIVRKKLPGQFFELNIQFGVYVGGDGHFKEQFLGHLIGLRGCMSNLIYGKMNLLEYARGRQGNSKVHGITWNCAAEFDSTFNSELSFIEDNAHILLLHSLSRAGARWQFDIKTVTNQSILIYNTGTSFNAHTIALEIINGTLSLYLTQNQQQNLNNNNNNNYKTYKIQNKIYISDNRWHKVIVQLNPYLLELTVDTTMETQKVMGTKYLDLSDAYFVGGLELTKRTRATIKGVLTAEHNFIGCLKGLAINGEPLGLSSAKSSFGIKPNICLSDTNLNKTAIELEIVSVKPVIVNEGKTTKLDSNNIRMIVDYSRWGLRDNMIQFRVIHSIYGKLHVHGTNSNKFTLLDIFNGKVEYQHDGSESLKDIVTIEIKMSELSTVPHYLHRSYLFNLTVTVIAQNDAPVIIAPGLLRMAKGTRKLITTEILNVTDVDDEPNKIVYYPMKSALNIKNGQIELIDVPTKALTSFTQKDINDKRIVFACIECSISSTTSNNNNITEVILFNVTDGKSAFQMLALKIFLYDLEIKIKQNKGIFAVHNSTSLIQSKDLQFTSNVADDFLLSHIRIDVVEQPLFGVLECKRDNKFWIVCDWFLTGDILQKHVRYRHTTGTPDFDEFKFRASVNKIHTSMVHNFTVTFIKLKLEQLHLNLVTLNGTSKSMITIDHIQYQTIPILASNKNIKYVITKLPKYGDMITNQNQNKLQNGDSFTQFDIEKEYLSYKLHMQTYSKLNDSIQFMVSSKNCENTFGTLNIVYIPSENLKQQSQVKLQALQVIEGEKANIGGAYLNVEIQSISKLVYNITDGPFHGNVQRCKRCTEKIQCKSDCENITVFSNDDLNAGVVFYSHDNSETRYDHFEFTVRALNFQYIGVFNVNVILKNDNPPRRVIDKILQVVIDQTKLITGQDLKYDDADINTTPHDIIFTCQMISNGILFNIGTEPHEKVTTFTQADLDNRQILFKHHGDEYGKIQLWITDGQFYENGVLEVYASKPFIKIISNQIIVKQFKSVVIDSKLLNIETNLNAIGTHIIYRVLKSPKYGYLKFSVNYDSVRFFSQDDLNAGHVIYVHNKTDYDSITDYFSVRVTCEGTYSEDKINIKILPTVYWEPMIILSTNESLFVEESTSVVIPKTHLEVLHPDIPAEEIIYYIKSKPKNGYLQIINEPNAHNSIETFDQRIINLGQLEYIQNVANKTDDQIIFNVTNGIIWLYNVVLNIQIIPEHFYLRTYQMNVTEGGSLRISKDDIQIITVYYKSQVSYYTITRLPNYGVIQIADSREHLRKFSERDLIKGLVKYVHDNSENFEDYFEIIAHAGAKESEVANIKINITPINDQVPILVNNTGLQMWEGACEQITSTHLGAIDGDIPHDTIIFRVSGNWWGNIVLKSNSTPLNSFTQQQIEDGLIYFNHTNGTIAKFLFRLTDNIHTSKEYIFTIETKPVDLKLVTNQGIHVFPFNRQVIGPNQLKSEASDPHRDIIYKVIAAPMLGRIVIQINNGHLYTTDNFSQKDLDGNRIFYEHTHPFDGLYANDSFLFNIDGHLLPKIINQKFNIDISVSSGDLNTYIPITPITVDEGGSAPILLNITGVIHFLETHANLHAPIIHATVWQPDHGTVYVNDNTNITTFTQSQLESNLVKYQHDHSDTLNDTIHFTLYLLPDYITLCTVNIPVHVNPINDQPFKLITQAPHMNVVYGENVTITKDLLLTEDPDTPPEHLEYGIINGLTEGKIVLAPDYTMPINTFTQKDINDGKVVYKHSGSNTTVSFHFRVWDGKFKPIYTIFNIRVIPVSISLNSLSPIYIQQGLNVASFTPQHIQIRTNVNENRIIYNVTHAPYFGTIYVQDVPKLSFTHDDLINGRVMYMQTNMTSPNDTFIIRASCVQNPVVSNSISVQMLVQPLMQRGNFTAIIGTQNKITLNILDATPLAELTGSNPQYRIVRKPTFGELHKIIRSSGERKIVYDQQIDTFNHEEIRIGVIYYVLPGDESLNDIEDLLKFLLIGNVFYQPAYGDLKIRILSDRVEPELKRHRGGMHLASPNISSDYLPIVIMVAGVLFLGVSVIIIIKCRSIDVSKQNARNNAINNQPIPLPRPPDHLMASTSNLKPFIEEIPLTAHHTSLPHCKVTPLGPTDSSLASSDLDIRSRYPYGSADDGTIIEDWCSQDAPSDSIIPHPQTQQPCINAANPLLRRNQYWV